MANKAYILRQGDIFEEVDRIRLAISAGPEFPWMRRSDVWKFFPRSVGTDFFVTSASLQSEMKGTVHHTQAQFGFNRPFRVAVPESWVGPIPPSRLYHTLAIPDLADGDHLPVFAVSFPGFALMQAPQTLEAGKNYVRVDPQPAKFETTFGLIVVQGDWRQFVIEDETDRFVGLLTGEGDRNALISVAVRPYEDPDAAVANIKRNLGLIDPMGRPLPESELSAHLWMEREETAPIRMIELHGLSAAPPA